ncbi:MAG: diguanylate cyclase domain-containing protein, partial [Bacillota bacterium]
SHNFEFKYKEKWYNLSLMPEFSKINEKKYVSAVITSARDITQLKKTQQKIKYQSFHDPLTGLYNRAYYNNKLSHYKKDKQLPLGFILADINGLKLTNDILGHIKGDKLIKVIANILNESSSKKDLVVRIGGDEFLILVPNTDKKEIKEIFSKIKKRCRETKDAPIKPSVAIGSCIKYKSEKSFDTVFKEAEDEMYENKMIESENTHNTIVDSLKDMIFEKTEVTHEHVKRLRQISIKLGKAMNLSEAKLNSLKLLAEYKDLGKIGLNNSYKREDKHVEIGYKIAKSSSKLNQISDAILAHHENWDGTGFPKGLKGKEIPLIARIMHISEFCYRLIKKEGIENKEEIIKRIKEKSGKSLDPEIVEVFIKKIL